MLEGWARDGLTDQQIATNMGISGDTYYRWKKQHAEISDALKRGKAPVDFEVESALLKRAKGYDYEEVITEMDSTGKQHVRKIKKHMPPDPTAAIFWLCNRKPRCWRRNPTGDDTIQDVEDLQPLAEMLKSDD